MTNIRPCPFCGGEVKLHELDMVNSEIVCENTDCLMQPATYVDDINTVIKAWNNRFTETKIKEIHQILAPHFEDIANNFNPYNNQGRVSVNVADMRKIEQLLKELLK